MSITHSATAETTNPSQATMKFAIVYIPGALMLGRSMNKIRAFLKHALTPHDIESMTWQYNPYEQKESALDSLLTQISKIPDLDERRLVLVGESYGLDIAIEFRQRHDLDALVIGSSPSATLLQPTVELRRKHTALDRRHYRDLFNNDVGEALARNWFKWHDQEYINPASYDAVGKVIIFTGVAIDNPNPKNQTRLNKDHLEFLHSYPRIMSINLDGQGHRVMLTAAAFIAFTCRPFIMHPDLRPSGHLKLPNIDDPKIYHPMDGEIVL